MEHGKKGEVEENLDKVPLPTLQAMAPTLKRREDSVLPEPRAGFPCLGPRPHHRPERRAQGPAQG